MMQGGNDMLRALLEDPEKLRMIAGLASSLLGKASSAPPAPPDSSPQETHEHDMASAFSAQPSYEDRLVNYAPYKEDGRYADRINLLRSLRPFVGGGRQSKIDGLIGALSAANVIDSYKQSGMGMFDNPDKHR